MNLSGGSGRSLDRQTLHRRARKEGILGPKKAIEHLHLWQTLLSVALAAGNLRQSSVWGAFFQFVRCLKEGAVEGQIK